MKVAEFHDKKLTEAVSNLMEVFSGEDGGVGFVKVCMGLKFVEASLPAPQAQEILDVVYKFSRLVGKLKKDG